MFFRWLSRKRQEQGLWNPENQGVCFCKWLFSGWA